MGKTSNSRTRTTKNRTLPSRSRSQTERALGHWWDSERRRDNAAGRPPRKNQGRNEFQSSSRSNENCGRVTHGIVVHPFYRIIDSDCCGDVNGKRVGTVYKVRLEIPHAKPRGLR